MAETLPPPPPYDGAVESVRPLPWLALALATGLVGWFLGRWSAPTPEADPGPSEPRLSAPTRAGPMLEGAPTRSGSRVPQADGSVTPPGGTSGEAPPPGATAEGPVGEGPPIHAGGDGPAEVTLPGFTLDEGFLKQRRSAQLLPGAAPLEEDTVLTEITRLMASDPGAANARVESLFESGRPEDRQRAYRALAQARHPLNRRLAQRALDDARPDDDVQGLLRTLARFKGRDWSAEQLTGPPDTPIAGDLPTAWASKEQDMGEVWLELDYAESVLPQSLRIHETYNPGAVARVYAMDGDHPADADTVWIEIWRGEATAAAAPIWFEVPLSSSRRTRTIRLIVDTNRVGGWNEIDAVELLGDGRRQWAVAARAGSSYGE